MGLCSCRVCIVTVDNSAATMSYFPSLLPTAEARYLKKLQVVGLSTCPYEPPPQAWVDDVTRWLKVELPDIILYLIDTLGEFTCEKLKVYKSFEAYNGPYSIKISK